MSHYKIDLGSGLANGFEVCCSECSYQHEYFLGKSVFDLNRDFLLSLEPEHIQQFEKVLANHKIRRKHSERRLYKCTSCGGLGIKQYATVLYDQDQSLETNFHCKICQAPMKTVLRAKEINESPCPQCSAGVLKIGNLIHWD